MRLQVLQNHAALRDQATMLHVRCSIAKAAGAENFRKAFECAKYAESCSLTENMHSRQGQAVDRFCCKCTVKFTVGSRGSPEATGSVSV